MVGLHRKHDATTEGREMELTVLAAIAAGIDPTTAVALFARPNESLKEVTA